jgi:alginate O-acetyltransferase complex protein AlgJ
MNKRCVSQPARIGAILVMIVMAFFGTQQVLAEALVIQGRDGWLFPIWENLGDVNQPRIDANVALISAVKDQLADQGIQLVVVIVPMKASFYVDRLPASRPVSREVLQRFASVIKRLEATGILTVDTLSALRETEQSQQLAFFRTDYHWTAQGSEATAELVGRLIEKSVQFDYAPGGGSALGDWTNVRRYGDLATRFMTAEQRLVLGRERFRVRASPTENMALLDDDPAEIHLIGNSFVQPYLGFPQKLSQVLNRPVSLSWKPGNIGPWITFLDYLESDEYLQNKPKLIVWQLNEPRMESGPNAAGDWDTASLMPDSVWLDRVRRAISR